ncbi:hypothetical protein LY76DRAFT_677655 [Colletotrichum caudatum]|nr:hypothetical protein LY76DRAFT_677655 [Colletotrichum caudatum]
MSGEPSAAQSPSHLLRLPELTEQYFKCLGIGARQYLRGRGARLAVKAARTSHRPGDTVIFPSPRNGRPTFSHQPFSAYPICCVGATHEVL